MANHPTFTLRDKVIVQFGGSGLLGSTLAAAIADAKATLIVASRNSRAPEVATSDCERTQAETVDIGDEASVHQLRDRVLAQHGRVDGVVFNAIQRPMLKMSDPLAMWQASMATNATGFFSVMRTFGDAMSAQGSGSIVNISSIQGMIGTNPSLYEDTTLTSPPDYFFHKGGMLNLTRYLASHYGSRGVRVNAVSPGGIFNSKKPVPAKFRERYDKMTMLGRMADATEVTGAVIFLLSDASSYITGANLPVDGGYTAK